MRRFRCLCNQPLFFDNTTCEHCGRPVGFAPDRNAMLALGLSSEHSDDRLIVEEDVRYRVCSNRHEHQVCNWLIRAEDSGDLCVACGLNQTIPDLSWPDNLVRWAHLEAAKRRLIYSLLNMGLPVKSRVNDPERGLAFDFLEDCQSDGDAPAVHVATGHADGIITINVAEADPVERVRSRERMNEQYRTLLGHMRHESGHYYWDLLIRDDDALSTFRQRFGDERDDYNAALQRHYSEGPSADWSDRYISAYASSHPWEDWAETWAHYLHMTDTLETARDFGVACTAAGSGGASLAEFDEQVAEWLRLSVMLNELNRSMGQGDTYPFVVPSPVVDKLRFIDEIVRRSTRL